MYIVQLLISQQFQCVCKIGFAGDGTMPNSCAPDSDLDGWPDHTLNCTENSLHCKEDNCIFIPNSGQEDADNDGIGIIKFRIILLNSFYKFVNDY